MAPPQQRRQLPEEFRILTDWQPNLDGPKLEVIDYAELDELLKPFPLPPGLKVTPR